MRAGPLLSRLAVPVAIGVLAMAAILIGALIASRGSGGPRTAAGQIAAFDAPQPRLRAADLALRARFARLYATGDRTSAAAAEAPGSQGSAGTVLTARTRILAGRGGFRLAAAPTTTGAVCTLEPASGRGTCAAALADGAGLTQAAGVISGIVPDGVVRIELRARSGATFEVAVRHNVFRFAEPVPTDPITGYSLVYADGHANPQRYRPAG